MLRDDRPSLLMVTHWARKGGAERIVVQLLDGLADDYRVALGFVWPVPERDRTLRWPGREVGLREIFFGKWDLIHTHLFLPGLLVRLRRIWDGSFRWVHTVHYQGYDDLRLGALRRWIDLTFVFPGVDALVAVSESIRDALAERLPRVELIENAVRLAEPPRAAPGEDPGEARGSGPVVGTVSMLRAEKGVDDLIRAAVELRERLPGLRIRIAGDGPERERLEALASDLGVADVVELSGYLEDLAPFYRSLDVYVQPSRSETFGLAALEAMLRSTPVVSAAVGHLPSLLGNGAYGALVERGSGFVERLVRTIEDVVVERDAYRARAERGRAHWSERLDPDAMEAGYRDVYRRARLPAVCMIQPVVTHAGGGLARQLLLQSRELARRGHRVVVVQRDDPALRSDPDVRERWRHADFPRMPRLGGPETAAGGLRSRLRGAAFVLAAVVALLRVRRRVDVLHAHQLHSPTLAGATAKTLLGTPLVSKGTASGAYGEAGQIRRLPFTRLRLLALRRVDRILALSPTMARELRALGADDARIVEVPNSVELPAEAASQPKPPGGPFRLLFTGRLSTEKSLETLVDAAGLLASRGHEVVVELVGDPDPERDAEPGLRARAEDLHERHGRALEIRFRGFRQDVERFYREADAFVLPSRSEGMSNALLEALAFGVPCVVSDIPENRAVVDDGRTGLVFRRGSPDALAERLARLLRSRDRESGDLVRRLATGGRREAERRFSVDAVVDALEEIYAELAEGQR